MKLPMVNYSNAFPSHEYALDWAVGQLPLVERYGSRLFIAERTTKRAVYYCVWRTLTKRDSEPLFRDHTGGWLPIVDWLRLGSVKMLSNSYQVMDTKQLVEVS